MPSMLVRPESAAVLLERLEIHYLANPDPQLRFALLTDFADAPAEHVPEDEGYVQRGPGRRQGPERAVRRRTGPTGSSSSTAGGSGTRSRACWMGWERKRGKLSEFNRLLRGRPDTSYAVAQRRPRAACRRIRFVITLDADTQLPRDTARRLVGTIAHPLNRPRFDPAAGRVVEGYGVLQPRVSFHLTAATRSRFAALLASSAGIDPYSTAVSDVYMDLFGVGSFTGKGIYDVDAFEAATGHTFPENQILSHDLIEGNYARCGLVTDIELFDDFPARYHAYARREHRWVRGDWQLLPWLGRARADARRAAAEPAADRWSAGRSFDNLRRSLVPPAAGAAAGPGLDGPARLALALDGCWRWRCRRLPLVQLVLGTVVGGRPEPVARAGSAAWRDSVPPTAAQVAAVDRLPGRPGAAAGRRDRRGRSSGCSSRAGTCWSGRPPRRPSSGWGRASAQFVRTMWPAPALAVGARPRWSRWSGPRPCSAAAPVLLAWLALAAGRLLGQPAAGRPPSRR